MGVFKRFNTTILAALAAAATSVAPLGGDAAAQNAGRQFGAIGARDAAAMLAEFQISTELRASQRTGGAPLLLATTAGGAKFLLGFLQCQDPANAEGCRHLMITTAQSSVGVAFEDLNQFNGTSNVTTAVYDSTNQILIFGRNIFVPGGVGRENLKLQIALFLKDMAKYAESRVAGATTISLNVGGAPLSAGAAASGNAVSGKIDNAAGADNAAARALYLTPGGGLEVDVAGANDRGVNFAPAGGDPR